MLHLKEAKKKEKAQVDLCLKQRAWMAYYQDDDGVRSPVRDTQNTESDQDWIGLRFTDYDGPRIRVGVLKVLNKSAESEERGAADKIEVPVSGIQETLTVSLYNTKRFDVIEQKRVQEVESQQKRTDVMDLSPVSVVNMGKSLQVQYLVYGTVNEWTPDRSSRNVSQGGNAPGGPQDGLPAFGQGLVDRVTARQVPVEGGAEADGGAIGDRSLHGDPPPGRRRARGRWRRREMGSSLPGSGRVPCRRR